MALVDEFIADCGGSEKLEGLSTRQVCRRFLKPMTKDKHKERNRGASYVSWKRREMRDGVADAEIFVCHAWDADFMTMIRALKFHIGEEQLPRVSLWIDVFCNNQHKDHGPHVKKHKTVFLTDTLKKTIGGFDRFIVMFDDWHEPTVFKRAWSLLELYYAIEADLPLEIVLPQGDIKAFRRAIAEDDPTTIPYSYFRMLSRVDIRSAKSHHPLQHKLIVRALKKEGSRENLTPILNLNDCVLNFFKNWIIREASYCIVDAKQALDEKAEIHAKESLANIFRFDCRPEVATEIYRDSLRWRLESDPDACRADTVRAMYMLANSYSLSRDSETAAKWYERTLIKTLAPLQAVNSDYNLATPDDMFFIRKVLSHPDTIMTIKNLCGELYVCGQKMKMFAYIDEIYDKYRMFLGTSFDVQYPDGVVAGKVAREYIRLRHRSGPVTRKVKPLHIGVEVDHNVGGLEEGKEEWKHGVISSVIVDTHHPLVAMIGNVLGYLCYLDGDYREAEVFVKDALTMRQKYLGDDSAETLVMMRLHAAAQEKIGNLETADKYYEKHFKVVVGRYQSQDQPSVVAKLQLHEAAFLHADFLARNGGSTSALQKYDLKRYAFDAAELLGWLHPDAMKLKDLYVKILRNSTVRDKYLKADEFSIQYMKLRFRHRGVKLVLVADKFGGMDGIEGEDLLTGSTKVNKTPGPQDKHRDSVFFKESLTNIAVPASIEEKAKPVLSA
jgi:tetratricopeptide (TPR) repeat protein